MDFFHSNFPFYFKWVIFNLYKIIFTIKWWKFYVYVAQPYVAKNTIYFIPCKLAIVANEVCLHMK